MPWIVHRFLHVLLCLSLPLRLVQGQETERPVPFDRAGRLVTISFSLAERLQLGPPHWPVAGSYVDARLYEQTGGDFVIVVQKRDGSVDRYPVTAATRQELSDILARAMASTGLATTAEATDMISEPAGSRFVVNQVLGGLMVYAPAAAALATGSTAGMLYLLTAGGTFFVATGIANATTVTKAQNALATDGIFRGAIIGNGVRYALGISTAGADGDRKVALASFAGAITGTVVGFNIGRRLTDAEAAGAATGSTVVAATTAGLLGMGGAYGEAEARGAVGTIVGSALAGFPLGLRYVRRAPYRVTAGDVSSVLTAGLLGALTSTVLIPDDPSEAVGWGIVTTGFLAGLTVGDRGLARAFDFTESEANLVRLGAIAGALMGFAIPAAAETDNGRAVLAFGSAGAILGGSRRSTW
ncbi:MAG: hypothetical protein HUU26_04540 [Gemmatimonadaceae bacterium]|nr:hypothetical protein [Gemmatimonadaceae bacterium]